MTNAIISRYNSKEKVRFRWYLFLPVALLNQTGLTKSFLLTLGSLRHCVLLVSTHLHQTGSAFPLLDLLVTNAKPTGIEYILTATQHAMIFIFLLTLELIHLCV